MDLSTFSTIKKSKWFQTIEELLLLVIGFSFVFKISLSTLPLLLLLLLNISYKKEETIAVKQKLLTFTFFSLYLLFLATFLVSKEQSGTLLIKTLGFLFIPLLFYFKKFSEKEILIFLSSFIFFQLIHIIYVDYVMIKAIFIDNIKDYDGLTILVKEKFIIERPYFSLNSLLLMIFLKFIFDHGKINFTLMAFIYLFSTISLFLIGARLAMGVSVLLFFLIFLKSKGFTTKHFLILLASFFILFIPIRNYTMERIFLKRGEPRIVIWDCAYKIIKDDNFNFFLGEFSEDKSRQKLIDCYNSKEVKNGPYWWIGEHNYNYNTHNQFLGFFISYGILGLFMFLFIFVIQFYDFVKKDNFISLLIVAVFFFQCFFENILSRNLGIYLFLWVNFLFIPQKNE